MDALHRTLKHPCPTRWNSKYDSLKLFLELQQRLPSQMDQLCRCFDIVAFSSKQLWALGDYIAVSFSRNSMPCTNTWERVWGGVPASPGSTLDIRPTFRSRLATWPRDSLKLFLARTLSVQHARANTSCIGCLTRHEYISPFCTGSDARSPNSDRCRAFP